MMEAMRESWTDARLDDFAQHTDRRFDEVDHRFDKVDMQFEAVDRRFEDVDRRFDSLERRMEAGFSEVNARFDALQRTLLQLGGGLLAGLVVLLAALIGLIGTQL
jgi:tetrahydromethanopterin S-methyltransferase subunit G